MKSLHFGASDWGVLLGSAAVLGAFIALNLLLPPAVRL